MREGGMKKEEKRKREGRGGQHGHFWNQDSVSPPSPPPCLMGTCPTFHNWFWDGTPPTPVRGRVALSDSK